VETIDAVEGNCLACRAGSMGMEFYKDAVAFGNVVDDIDLNVWDSVQQAIDLSHVMRFSGTRTAWTGPMSQDVIGYVVRNLRNILLFHVPERIVERDEARAIGRAQIR